MAQEPLLRGRSYLLRTATAGALATVSPIRFKLNIDTSGAVPADELQLNEIGVRELELDRQIAFDPYGVSREMGASC